ncbi:MAG TPA: DUF6504 family protein [Nitrospirota bacterium]|nr:DUF6504 family protein [Nitrospirota bacterium]
MMDEMIEVIAYAGYRGEEIPRTFSLHGKRTEVVEIASAWTEEDPGNRARKRFFKVRGSDGRAHQIYHDEQTSAWFYVQKKQE